MCLHDHIQKHWGEHQQQNSYNYLDFSEPVKEDELGFLWCMRVTGYEVGFRCLLHQRMNRKKV